LLNPQVEGSTELGDGDRAVTAGVCVAGHPHHAPRLGVGDVDRRPVPQRPQSGHGDPEPAGHPELVGPAHRLDAVRNERRGRDDHLGLLPKDVLADKETGGDAGGEDVGAGDDGVRETVVHGQIPSVEHDRCGEGPLDEVEPTDLPLQAFAEGREVHQRHAERVVVLRVRLGELLRHRHQLAGADAERGFQIAAVERA
jgi:hypothetical protein